MSSVLQVKNVCLEIDNFNLDHISIDFYPGEIHGIMGENGSGKSLLMQLISGFIAADQGLFIVDGQLYQADDYHHIASSNTFYIDQAIEMLDNLSIAENLFFHHLPYQNHWIKKIDYEKLNHMYRQLIEELELPLTINDTLDTIGLAQRQIIQFCKAFISDAKIIILDEPSATLSTQERDILYRIVQHIKDRGAIVIYVTHCLKDISAICDKVSVIRDGRCVATKPVSNTTEKEIIHLFHLEHLKNIYPKINIKKGRQLLNVQNLNHKDKLSNINLSLHEGEVIGITGLAGSGRTLLANCLFGMTDTPNEFIVNGKHVTIDSPIAAIHNGIAFMPEDRFNDSIFLSMTTDENLALPSFKRFSKNRVINEEQMHQSVDNYFRKIKIPANTDLTSFNHNRNHLQKAIFAKWIMSRANIFILDEPNRGVDIPSKIDTYNFINDLIRKKAGIILISSDIEEIFGICDRIYVLSNRTFVCDYQTSDTTIEEILHYATKDVTA